MKKYTKEQIDYIKENITGKLYFEIIELFYAQFGIMLTHRQLKDIKAYYKIQSGFIPIEKIKALRGNKTTFKNGNRPHNAKPVGSEKIDEYGILQVKTAEPKTWRPKHVLIWENLHGDVPAGHVVIFADGDKNNFSVENLLLVSRRELMVMNHRKLITNNTNLTKTGKIIADVYLSALDKTIIRRNVK